MMPIKDPVARREHHKTYMKHYLQDPENKRKHVARVTRTKGVRQLRLTEMISARRVAGCSKCDEKAACCMDFHHTNPLEKRFAVSEAVTRCVSLATLKKELDKCVVLCRNCHAKQHDVVAGAGVEPTL
jgi:hypothetical protein